MTDRKSPLVSIVICNFNYERYLREAVYSVLRQSYRNLQVIIVDDGSTDGSRSVLSDIADSRVITVFQENQGQAAAFNAGLSKCSGEFVAFLDSDDFWYPNKIEVSINNFQDDEVVLVQHNLAVVDECSIKSGRIHPGMNPGRLNLNTSYFSHNHTSFFCPTSGLMCRKSALDKIYPIADEWKICADVAFTRPLLIFGALVTLPNVLGAYRIHDKNAWMNSEAQTKRIQNNQLYCDYVNSWLDKMGHTQRVNFLKSELYLYLLKAESESKKSLFRLKNFIKRSLRKTLAVRTLIAKLKMQLRKIAR